MGPHRATASQLLATLEDTGRDAPSARKLMDEHLPPIDAGAHGPARVDPPDACDLLVVGGGIVGLSVARELLARYPDRTVCVLEREPVVGFHQTGHNSGVIHAGIYYKPGSLKARLCVAGAERLYAYCEARGVPTRRNGKLIVALTDAELPRLDELERRGRANGVPGLRRVGATELRDLEPHAVATCPSSPRPRSCRDRPAFARRRSGATAR